MGVHVLHRTAALPAACRVDAVGGQVEPAMGRIHGCHSICRLEPSLVVPVTRNGACCLHNSVPFARSHHAVSLGVLDQSHDEFVAGMVHCANEGSLDML